MEEASLFSLVLADEGIDDIEGYAVTEFRESIEFWDGDGELGGGSFEAEGVVDAADGEAVEGSGDAGTVVVEEWGDIDDAGDFLCYESGNKRFPSNAFIFKSEFGVAEDEVSEERSFVEGVFVVAGIGAAFGSDSVLGGEVDEAGVSEVGFFLVPNDEVLGLESGGEEAFDNSGDDFQTGAAIGAGEGEHFNSDDVLG